MYHIFDKIINQINTILSTYKSLDIEDLDIDPTKGKVAFGSAKGEWGFTLAKFAKIYSNKFGINMNKMMEKLWGDNYFDLSAKKWRVSPKE